LKVDEKRKRWRFIFIHANILSLASFFYSVGACVATGQKGFMIDIFSVGFQGF
jgi:hypothetical protein